MSDTTVASSVTGAEFSDGTTMTGTWTTEYNAAGDIEAITSSSFTLTNSDNTTDVFTGAGALPYADSPADGSYEMVFAGQGTGDGADSYLYVDWSGETPGTIDANGGGGRYTSYVLNGDGSAPIHLETGGVVADTIICFMAGTMVSAPSGKIAIEDLKAGDLVSLNDGYTAPVRWIGRQPVSTVFADKLRVLPIRITAGALGENLPERDLLVSPCHALLVDGILIQAGALVNGASIIRESSVPETFTYYHVELADHSLILAEGVPAETFVDNASRRMFENWAEHEALFGTQCDIAEMTYPRAKSIRQIPAATRQRLASLAGQAGRVAA